MKAATISGFSFEYCNKSHGTKTDAARTERHHDIFHMNDASAMENNIYFKILSN